MVRLTLHAKILFLVLGSLVVSLGALSYVIVQRESRLLAEKADEKQHLLALTIYADLKSNMMKGTPRSTLELIDSIKGVHDLERLIVLRNDGTPAFGQKASSVSIPRVGDAFSSGGEISFQEPGPVPLHTILFPLKNEKDCSSCHRSGRSVLGVLVVSLSRAGALMEIRSSVRSLALSLGSVIALIGAILYIVIRRVVLTPLATLREGADRIGRGDLTHRIVMPTKDELQELSEAFNVMAGHLGDSYAEMEHNIGERTAQLRDAMEEIREKARRLYAHSRDMATISRLSTRIFNAELSLDDLLDRFLEAITRGLSYRRTIICLVDRKRGTLAVRRSSGMDDRSLPLEWPLDSDHTVAGIVRSGKIAVLSDHDQAARDAGFPEDAGESQDIFVVPLLSRTQAKPCWQQTNCLRTECPAYEEGSRPCWIVEQTLCGNSLVESFRDKLTYCMTCRVFPVLGVVVVAAASRKRPGRGRHLGVLRILAAEMAAALENLRLHQTNQQMVGELMELHRVTVAALSDLSLPRTLEAFTDSAMKLSGLDACTFWLVTADKKGLVRRAGACAEGTAVPDICPERIPLSHGLLAQALQPGNKFVVDYDVCAHDSTTLGRAAAEQGFPALLAVPLRSEAGPFGVFTAHKRSAMPFLDTEIAALMLLANQAAMAISVCTFNEELNEQNRELGRQTGLLSGILASMASGVMMLGEDTTVTLINNAGADIFRVHRDEFLGRKLTSVFPDAVVFIRSGQGAHREVDLRFPDGSMIPVGFSASSYQNTAGEPEGYIVVFRDLSEIKALQTELLNNERFAAMGKVVAGVAHEIRNPLFGISSIGQIFERELSDPAHQSLARALLAETTRMNRLVEELLRYGKPAELHREHCDPAILWQEVVDGNRDELDLRGIRFSSDLHAGRIVADLDGDQMRHLFSNLLRNALDATADGGVINLQMMLGDRFILFKITDNGVGIPAADVDKTFDLFFTTKPKGTGLGLSICRKIVQDHGGEIAVESEVDSGTTVTVRLPYRETAEPDQA